MKNIIRDWLVRPGILTVKTKQDFEENSKISVVSAADYTREVNQVEALRKNFLFDDALYRRQLESDSVVQTHIPAGSYSPGAIQVVALRPEIVRNEQVELVNGRVPTRTIYDLPQDAQQEYFRQILAATYATDEQYRKLGHGDYTVLFTENAAQMVSDETRRIARTIAEPHVQIWVANGTTEPLGPDSKLPQPLRKEQKIIALHYNEMNTALEQIHSQNPELLPDFQIRFAPPYGYVMHTGIRADMRLEQQSLMLANLMRAHHTLYATKAHELVGRLESNPKRTKLFEALLPQPSYKLFGTVNRDRMLDISIAPTLIAKTGVVEVLERKLLRSVNSPAFFANDREEFAYFNALKGRLEDSLD